MGVAVRKLLVVSLFGAIIVFGCAVKKSKEVDYDLYSPYDLYTFSCSDDDVVNIYQVIYENVVQIEMLLRAFNETVLTPVSWENPTLVGYRQANNAPEFELIYSEFQESQGKLILDEPSLLIRVLPCIKEVGDVTYISVP